MTIIKYRCAESFTVIPNDLINDESLTDTALALAVWLISRHPDFNVSMRSLVESRRFGQNDKVSKALACLKESGYARYDRSSDGTGEWVITNRKHDFGSQVIENQPESENRILGEKPESGNRIGAPYFNINTSKEKKDIYPNGYIQKKKKNQPLGDTKAAPTPELTEEQRAAFLAFRKAKHAPLTPRAWELLLTEFAKARLTPAAAVDEMILRGWTGFRAEWLKPKPQTGKPYAEKLSLVEQVQQRNWERAAERERKRRENESISDAIDIATDGWRRET